MWGGLSPMGTGGCLAYQKQTDNVRKSLDQGEARELLASGIQEGRTTQNRRQRKTGQPTPCSSSRLSGCLPAIVMGTGNIGKTRQAPQSHHLRMSLLSDRDIREDYSSRFFAISQILHMWLGHQDSQSTLPPYNALQFLP